MDINGHGQLNLFQRHAQFECKLLMYDHDNVSIEEYSGTSLSNHFS